ncbi:WXG100 family type VII secretion target [Streptomyces sp. TR02-1]|uniref:WXG100 family type VII secretion target n=1 Tax=Streptomyces sp. TR02-1 TaxID=3385977 RepID=UPI0039A3E0C5
MTKIATAAAEWRKLPSKYEGLLDQFESQVVNRLKGSWEGEAAAKGFAHMRKAREQYEAAAVEARRIARLLDDTHSELIKWQKELQDFLEDARKDKFKVDDTGTIADVHPTWESPVAGKDFAWKEQRQKLMSGYTGRLERILSQATAADIAADMALRKDSNGSDDQGFNRKGYASGDAAEAAKASAIAKKAANGEELSKTELNQLNHLLKVNRNDTEFSAKFTTSLGSQGTMNFWTSVANPQHSPGVRLPEERRELLKQMQKNLGTTLGTASQTDKFGMKEWKQDTIDLGPEILQRPHGGPAPYGFQVTSNLMRYGEWDNEFLTDYGEKLIATERALTGDGLDPKILWDHPVGTRPSLNIGAPNDLGTDPMTGFMEALGHSSPEVSDGEFVEQSAATEFLADQKNYEYLMEQREWPEDGSQNSDQSAGYDSLGHALEAAVTGHPYDEAPSGDLPAHTQEQASLMTMVVHDIAERDSLAREGMYDSLGEMAAEYLPDFNQELHKDADSAESLFPTSGAKAPFGERDAARFLLTIGGNPDGYAAVNLGQTAYTSSLMDYHLQNPDASPQGREETIRNIAASNGEVQGLIGIGRREDSIGNVVQSDAEYNESLKTGGKWAQGIVGVGIGVGASFIATPAVGAGVGAGATSITNSLIDEMIEGRLKDNDEQAVYSAGYEWEHVKDSTRITSQEAFTTAALGNDVPLTKEELADYRSYIASSSESGMAQAEHDITAYARDKKISLPN